MNNNKVYMNVFCDLLIGQMRETVDRYMWSVTPSTRKYATAVYTLHTEDKWKRKDHIAVFEDRYMTAQRRVKVHIIIFINVSFYCNYLLFIKVFICWENNVVNDDKYYLHNYNLSPSVTCIIVHISKCCHSNNTSD